MSNPQSLKSSFRCDYYKCQDNCTLAKQMKEGYYIMNLAMHDLHLHPGDHKPLLSDEAFIDTFMYDDEFDDLANQTFFDNIRYYFLVSYRY
jgi:hypothetical protein